MNTYVLGASTERTYLCINAHISTKTEFMSLYTLCTRIVQPKDHTRMYTQRKNSVRMPPLICLKLAKVSESETEWTKSGIPWLV